MSISAAEVHYREALSQGNVKGYIAKVISSFRSKALKRFWARSDASGIRPDWVGKIERQLTLLDEAKRPEEMDFPTFGFHALSGDLAGRYAVTVSRNWRLTFGFEGQNAVDVDLEDYHGR